LIAARSRVAEAGPSTGAEASALARQPREAEQRPKEAEGNLDDMRRELAAARESARLRSEMNASLARNIKMVEDRNGTLSVKVVAVTGAYNNLKKEYERLRAERDSALSRLKEAEVVLEREIEDLATRPRVAAEEEKLARRQDWPQEAAKKAEESDPAALHAEYAARIESLTRRLEESDCSSREELSAAEAKIKGLQLEKREILSLDEARWALCQEKMNKLQEQVKVRDELIQRLVHNLQEFQVKLDVAEEKVRSRDAIIGHLERELDEYEFELEPEHECECEECRAARAAEHTGAADGQQ
jgi:chromosome segregation ATPase